MKRRRSRKGPLVQAAVLSLTAVATALVVVLAGRRRAIDDGAAALPAEAGDGAYAAGMDAPTLTGAAKR
ncbi:hypothetical protein [Micromonospora sp. NPDC050200]|uniref:hypothetical protein n=1 Tax=Micromonospora sp. NPDC050200 TaxID=3155664 RepID=UPI003410D4CD